MVGDRAGVPVRRHAHQRRLECLSAGEAQRRAREWSSEQRIGPLLVPRAVSSEASPTRPLWAVTRRAMPAAEAAAVNRWPICWPVSGTTRAVGAGPVAPTGVRWVRKVRTARAAPVLR